MAVTVTPVADPSKRTQAIVVIQSSKDGGVTLSSTTSTLAANHRTTLTATSSDSPGSALNWTVNNIPGGNASLGMICATGSSPCQQVPSSTATVVDYVAPGSIPGSNPVSITVADASNASETASTQITVINHLLVSVLPSSITLLPSGTESFNASVLGDDDQSVIWQIQGCGVNGTCGSIDALGNYSAPGNLPAPNSFQIVAISVDDSSQSGSASVTISNALNVSTLQPSSVYAGAANGFTLRVLGSGFVPSNPGPGSTLVVGGSARFTTCASAGVCTTPLRVADSASAGSVGVRVQNPDNSQSNIVQLKVVQPSTTENIVTLSGTVPKATGMDLSVVDLTTSGVDSADATFDLDVAAIGAFATNSNTCSLAGNPIPLQRPASGVTAADVCLFSSAGFDTSMSYVVSGPGDVTVISKQPAGLGIIHLTLQIPATAAPGARTLFIQNANFDRTAASGVLQIR